MLLNCVISFLYMRVLNIIFRKYFFFSFLHYFYFYFFYFFFVWSVRTVFLFVWTVQQFSLDVPASSLDMRFSAISYMALRPDSFSDMFGWETLEGYITFPPAPHDILFLSFDFLLVCTILFGFSRASLTCSCLFVISLHHRYVSLPFYWFLLSFYA
jgi:hypothetical protein